jgi:hypothetical protein
MIEGEVPGVARFFAEDPWGNRFKLLTIEGSPDDSAL